VWRRFFLYAAGVLVVVGLEALVVFVWRVQYGIVYSGFVIPPLLTTLVYAFVWADVAETPPSAAATWERVLERSWAVIVIDLVLSIVQIAGVEGVQTGDPLQVMSGIALLIASAALIFADTSATVDDMPVWWTLPGAFWRGARAVRNGPVFLRAVAIVALGLLAYELQAAVFEWMKDAHISNAEFWSQIPIEAVTIPPIAALTALVYRDATAIQAQDDAQAS
jgi:hypothetical protein